MSPSFAPIPPRETAADACAAAIEKAILRGELPVGTRLPPERTLAETFGVNRVTVRSALGQLAARGLLTVRQGSGYRVRDYRRVGGLDLFPTLWSLVGDADERLDALGDLLAIRRRLAELVLERLRARGPSALAPLHVAVEEFAKIAATGDEASVATADLEVLAALLEATGSPALQLCFNPVATVLSELPALRAAMYADPSSNVAAYRALLAWLDAPPQRRAAPAPILRMLEERDARTLARLRRSLKGLEGASQSDEDDERSLP